MFLHNNPGAEKAWLKIVEQDANTRGTLDYGYFGMRERIDLVLADLDILENGSVD